MKKLLLVLIPFIFLSCATSLKKVSERPAEFDLDGAKSISVLPLQFDSIGKIQSGGDFVVALFELFIKYKDPNKKEISDYFTHELTRKLVSSNYFEVVSADKIQNAIKNNDTIPVDVYLSGEIEDYDSSIETNNWTEIKKNGSVKEKIIHTEYTKTVKFNIKYQVISGDTYSIISYGDKKIEATYTVDSTKSNLPSDASLVHSKLDSLVYEIMQKLEPYTVSEKYKLMKIKMKTDELKRFGLNSDDVKEADKFAKSKELSLAKSKYLKIYEKSNNYEAGYNATVIMLVENQLEEAKALCKKLYNENYNKKIRYLYNSINDEIEYSRKLEKQKAARKEK